MTNVATVPGWLEAPFDRCVKVVPEKKPSVPRSEYLESGTFPVVDQGVGLVAGYTDDGARVYDADLPLIVFGDHTRAIKYVDFPFATGADGTKLLRANEDILDTRFLYFCLLALDIPSRGYNRHFGLLREMSLHLPEKKREQSAIAGVLAKIQRAIEVEDRRIAALKELKAATIAKVFREGPRHERLRQTEVGDLPESWGLVPLVKLLREPLRNGHSAAVRGDGKGIRTLTLTAVTKRDFCEQNTKLTAAEPYRVQDLWIKDGDIFVERANTYEMVGLAALYRGPNEFAIFPDLLIRVRIDQDLLMPEILVEWLLSRFARAYFQKSCRGAATSMPKIDHATLEDVLVPIPPRSDQQVLARLISVLDGAIKSNVLRACSLKSLFSSCLHELMTGQLRVTPPLDRQEAPDA